MFTTQHGQQDPGVSAVPKAHQRVHCPEGDPANSRDWVGVLEKYLGWPLRKNQDMRTGAVAVALGRFL